LCTPAAVAQRLPGEAKPTHYQLHFTPDLKAATFAGDEVLDVQVPKPTSTVALNANEITFDSVTASQNGKQQTGSVQLDKQKQFAAITFPQPLSAGTAQLHIVYKGILNDQLRGFYLSKGKDRNYATTQFESTDARRAFPGFDEPAYKATFDISLTIDQGDTAISNGSIAKDTPEGNGKHTLTFTTTPKMSTYLVAMAVGDWKCSEGEQDGIPVRICATPDKANLTSYALTSAKQILHFYNNYYGIKWPFKKLDVLAVPDFEAGAMENTAAIFYRETLLLIDEQHASVEAKRNVFDVLAHEMAHQWFGDLVTMQWWNDIWLNEGFATWMTYKPNEAVHPEWKGSQAEASETANTLTIDSRKTTRAIRQQATTPDEINELFDGIAYQKAASVLRMVENFIGPDVFRKGVNMYLQEHAYGNATAEDFWGAESRASGKPVDKIMKAYTEQAGAPLLSVACNGGSAKETQQRFFDNKQSFGSAPDQVWTIPVCVDNGGKSSCTVFSSKQGNGASCSGAYFNANGRGFYRTQYDDAQLKALNADALKPEEKVLLVSDQWALARAGQNSIASFMDFAQRFSGLTDRYVQQQIMNGLQVESQQLITDADRKQFQDWIRKTYTPLLQKIGTEPKPGEDDDVTELRPNVLMVVGELGRDPEVIRTATEFTQKYLQNPESVDATLAPSMLAVAALNGDEKLYNQFVQAMGTAKTPEVYYNLAFSLLGFEDPALLKRTILFATGPNVRNQDAPFIFSGALQNPYTREQAWPLIKENWPAIEKKFTMSSGSAVVNGAGGFCTAQEKHDVQQFFTEHKVASSERALRQALERIDNCIDFRANQGQNLQQWLSQHGQ
jgi:aminopeptidase N/puromycin-sensitive aminopeptidase